MSCIFLRTSWRTRGIIAARSCCWPDRRVTGCPARSQQACGSGHSGRKKQNKSMILTTPELIATLQHEVRILLHLVLQRRNQFGGSQDHRFILLLWPAVTTATGLL